VVKGEPDIFYRLVPKTPEQENSFWEASIKGRIVFYKDLQKNLDKDGKWKIKKTNVQKGILNFLKTFFLSRAHIYPIEFEEFMLWIKKHKILPYWKEASINLFVFSNQNDILKRTPFIKGLIFRIV
jgi:hypothetical protein